MSTRSAFTIQLTERCNLACKYCYVLDRTSRSDEDCSEEVLRRFIDFAIDNSGPHLTVTFFGGEPTLRKDLIRKGVQWGKDAARNKKRKSISFRINTNGILLDDEFGDFMAEAQIELEVSIDGPIDIHDRFRTDKAGLGSFFTVYENLVSFRSRHPEHGIRLMASVTDPEALPWLIEFTKQLKPASLSTNTLSLPKRIKKSLGRSYVEEAATLISERIRLNSEEFIKGDFELEPDVMKGINFMLGEEKATRYCEMPTNSTIVTQKGLIYPCPFFIGYDEFILGDIWNGFDGAKVFTLECINSQSIPACINCSEKDLCGGGCAFRAFEANQSLNQPSEEFCELTRKTNESIRTALRYIGGHAPELLLKTLEMPESTKDTLKGNLENSIDDSFVIGIAQECNMECTYCYLEDSGAEPSKMPVQIADKVVDHIVRNGGKAPFVCLFGGEPLLNFNIGKYIVEMINLRALRNGIIPQFHIVTNGTLITKEIARFLAKYRFVVQISIDGSRTMHNRNRLYSDGRGSYDDVVAALDILRKEDASLRIDAQAVITPANTDHIAIATHLQKLGFRRINFIRQAQGINGRQLIWSKKDIMNLARDRKVFFEFFMESAKQGNPFVDMQLAKLAAFGINSPEKSCACGINEFYINTAGDIYPCPLIYMPNRLRIGTCGVGLNDGRNRCCTLNREMSQECRECWALDWCQGGCHAFSDSCALWPRILLDDIRQEWCLLLRAEFARGIIAHQILLREAPAQLEGLRKSLGAI